MMKPTQYRLLGFEDTSAFIVKELTNPISEKIFSSCFRRKVLGKNGKGPINQTKGPEGRSTFKLVFFTDLSVHLGLPLVDLFH